MCARSQKLTLEQPTAAPLTVRRDALAFGSMEYQEQDGSVTYHCDKPSGPTALREAERRWAELLRRIIEVDPLWESATIRPIRVIRGELDPLSPSLTPHPPKGCRPIEATRMTRKKRIAADGLEVESLACPRCGEEMRIGIWSCEGGRREEGGLLLLPAPFSSMWDNSRCTLPPVSVQSRAPVFHSIESDSDGPWKTAVRRPPRARGLTNPRSAACTFSAVC